ncbi:hypothetical protein HPP92_018943 [Vanilla planifolia]|uniref:Uncharacterized protein n=1 Tax=Vanilla planifolia TaxID=51239 RepID=A0A835Q357_VANPL|nr:hypothetical protein HPP92_018943 [Vanilla planifolia]
MYFVAMIPFYYISSIMKHTYPPILTSFSSPLSMLLQCRTSSKEESYNISLAVILFIGMKRQGRSLWSCASPTNTVFVQGEVMWRRRECRRLNGNAWLPMRLVLQLCISDIHTWNSIHGKPSLLWIIQLYHHFLQLLKNLKSKHSCSLVATTQKICRLKQQDWNRKSHFLWNFTPAFFILQRFQFKC